jgi:homoserine kinase type II
MTNDDTALSVLLANYALAPPIEPFALAEQGTINATCGLRTGDGVLIWKTYLADRDLAPLRHEHRLLAWLAEQQLSFGVPLPIPTRDGATLCEGPNGWQALFLLLPGASPHPLEAEQAEAIGAALGELQRVLARYADTQLPGFARYGDLTQNPAVPDPFSISPDQFGLASTPAHDDIFRWWRTELAALRPFIDGAYRELPWQVIHGDFNTSNTLFREGHLTSVLDFELAMRDARALDAASGLYSVLGLASESPHWHLAAALWRGYRQVAQPTSAEIAAIPWLIRLRNAGSSVGWLGRFSTTNRMDRWLERIGVMRSATERLERNHHRLMALLEA